MMFKTKKEKQKSYKKLRKNIIKQDCILLKKLFKSKKFQSVSYFPTHSELYIYWNIFSCK